MTIRDVGQIGYLKPIDDLKKPTRVEPPAEDKVSVSNAKNLDEAISTAQVSASASRTQVVQALANAVRQGTYKPDPQRIAQQILEDAELIARLQALFKR
jgi:negative regulator of flagellin synthesis FlgM